MKDSSKIDGVPAASVHESSQADRAARLQKTLLTVAKMDTDDAQEMLRDIAEVDARTLEVERVGIWLFSQARSEITCATQYHLSQNRHDRGQILKAAEHPNYFEALEQSRTLAATDAFTDPRTREFTEDYLRPNNIRSMLDVPIWIQGQVVGIVCHEHVGEVREWTVDEQEFSASIADMAGLALESSRRKRAEQSLRDSEQRYRMLVDSCPTAIAVHDGERYVFVNPAAVRLFHAESEGDLIGRPILDTVHPDFRSAVKDRVSQLQSGDTNVFSYERKLCALDGTEILAEVVGTPVQFEGKPHVQVVLHDITSLRRMEEQLRHAQKMEAVGQLASGIAHDFGNLLAAIVSHLSIAESVLNPDHPAMQSLRRVETAVRQASAVSKSLLTFAKGAPMERRPVNLVQVMHQAIKLIRHTMPANVQVAFRSYCSEDAWILGDETQLKQIMMNLAINARDAMPDGGRIEVGIETDDAGSPAGPSADFEGPGVWVRISDTGRGMSQKTRQRIFEPFFTTKDGQHSGLGLAVVHGIVNEHGGAIRFETERGKGTTFWLGFPRIVAPRIEQYDHGALADLEPEGTVLIADPDPQSREILASMIESMGYEIQLANDAPTLQRLISAPDARVRMLVLTTDLFQSDGAGSAGSTIMDWTPVIPTVLISRSGSEAMDALADSHISMLQLPFEMSDLGLALREAVDRVHSPEQDA